jgi:hypothetical protein
MARVNFFQNRDDFRCLLLGQLGFATDFIASQTRLSPGQVLYRLRKGKTRRADYRSGDSEAAQLVQRMASASLTKRIKDKMDDQEKQTA